MDDPIAKLKTPEDCERFAINVEEGGKPELALAARRRAIERREHRRLNRQTDLLRGLEIDHRASLSRFCFSISGTSDGQCFFAMSSTV